jgi:hypothetical protein
LLPTPFGANTETLIGSTAPEAVMEVDPDTVNLQPIALLIVLITDEKVILTEPELSVVVIVHGGVDVTVNVPSDACLHVLYAAEVTDPVPADVILPANVDEAHVSVIPLTLMLVAPDVPLRVPAGLTVKARADGVAISTAVTAMKNNRARLPMVAPVWWY